MNFLGVEGQIQAGSDAYFDDFAASAVNPFSAQAGCFFIAQR
jgi:hypothetical protein